MAIGGGDGSSKENAITIETLEDLLQANTDNTGKYIKLTQDINPATEQSYTGSITTPSLKNYFYADTKKTISGLVVVGNSFITTPNNGPSTVENIDMLNCVFKATAQGGLISGGSGRVLTLKNSTVSIRCQISGYEASFSIFNNFTSFVNCSVYVQNSVKGTSGTGMFTTTTTTPVQSSNFIFENFYVGGYTGSTNSLWSHYTTSCAFVWKNCTFSSSYLVNSSGSSYDHAIQTYHAFTGCTFPSGQQTARCTKACVVACDSDTSTTGANYPFVQYSGTPTTLSILATLAESGQTGFSESLKNKQYLLDSGFLP